MKLKFNLPVLALTLIASTTVLAQQGSTMSTPSHLSNNTNEPFSTQAFENGVLNYNQYSISRVTYSSHDTPIVGNLFMPKSAPKGAIVVIGPVAFVKEQSPIQYASRLVKQGFAVLVFDPRYHGESGGEPRRYESRQAKVEDISAAVDYLAANSATKNLPIYGLGVCQGVNWMIEAATQDERIQKIAIVAGHYLTPDIANIYLGSAEKVAARIEAGKAAKATFDKTGEVKYIPIVSETDNNALLGAPVIRQFYSRWADRGAFWNFHGLWENRITQMSEAEIWGHDIRPVAAKLTTPVLMLHADRAASGSKVPREVFDTMPASNKKLEWLGSRNQMQFYEDALTIDLVSEHISSFLSL